jgi:hypothetical protein
MHQFCRWYLIQENSALPSGVFLNELSHQFLKIGRKHKKITKTTWEGKIIENL